MYQNHQDQFTVRLRFDAPFDAGVGGTASIDVWAEDGDEAAAIATGLVSPSTGLTTVVTSIDKIEGA